MIIILEVFVKMKISKLLAHTRPIVLISRINLHVILITEIWKNATPHNQFI